MSRYFDKIISNSKQDNSFSNNKYIEYKKTSIPQELDSNKYLKNILSFSFFCSIIFYVPNYIIKNNIEENNIDKNVIPIVKSNNIQEPPLPLVVLKKNEKIPDTFSVVESTFGDNHAKIDPPLSDKESSLTIKTHKSLSNKIQEYDMNIADSLKLNNFIKAHEDIKSMENEFGFDNLSVLKWKSIVFIAEKRYNDAYPFIQKALQQAPEDKDLRYNLAVIYYMKKENNKSFSIIEKLYSEVPDDNKIRSFRDFVATSIGR